MSISKTIRVDHEVFKKLQALAVANGIPFSTPNNVLRILFGLPPLKGIRHKPVRII
jgi:hypothetical protein